MNQDEYIADRLDNQIEWYDGKSLKNQKWFKRLQVILVVTSATIPFLTGYITDTLPEMKILVGGLGLAVTTISAVLGLYKFQENWIEYRTTCESLRHEKFLFLTETEPYNNDNPFSLLVQRVETLISKEHTNWTTFTAKKSTEK